MKTLLSYIEEKLIINKEFKKVDFFDGYLTAKRVFIISIEHPDNAYRSFIKFYLLELSEPIKINNFNREEKYLVSGSTIVNKNIQFSGHYKKSSNDILYGKSSEMLNIILPLSHIIQHKNDIFKSLKSHDNDNLSFEDINDMFFIDIDDLLEKYVRANEILIDASGEELDNIFNKIKRMKL